VGARLVLVVLAVLLDLLLTASRLPPILSLAATAITTGVGVFAVDLTLLSMAGQRRRQIDRSLPTFVDLLQLCLGAGMGLDGAIATVADRLPGPLSQEFGRYLVEVQELGRSRSEALLGMARDVGSSELQIMVESIVQASESGAGLLTLVASQARLLRQERRRQAEAQAQQAAIRMIIPMTLFVLPSLLLIILGPVVIGVVLGTKGG
jgi:tight adherence protein C